MSNGIKIDLPFTPTTPTPIDTRTVAETIAERNDIDVLSLYEGLEVYVKENSTKYRWIGTEWETVGSSGSGTAIDDTQASDTTTYSSNKIEADYQKINDNILTTNNKTIVGSINELNEEIGKKAIKPIPESYIKVYRNILEQPNGKITNGNKCTSTIGQGMTYLPETDYVLYHIKNNDVIENSLQDGHTYTLTYNSDSNATVEYFIFDYAVDAIDIKCIAKETATSGTKITMPTNSYWFQMNTLKSDNITNISLVDDAFPYDNIRLVVADGNVSDANTQIAVSTIGDIASVGEYIKLIPETIGIDSTGIYKYIDDKVGSGTGSGEFLTEDIEVKGIIDGLGYKDGDIISKDITANDFVKTLMRRVVHPTYTAPTVGLSVTPSIIEMGVETTLTIKPTFTQNDAGALTNVISHLNTDTLINENTIAEQFTYAITPTLNSNTILADFSYGDGNIKQNNFGEDDETGRILAGSLSKSASVTAVYPYYVGVSTTNTLDEAGVLALTKKVETKGNKTISYTTSQSYMVFAYPKSYGAIKSVIDKNGFEVVSSFTSSTVSINGVDYYVFCSNQCSGSYTMLFKY